jgi:hypothetical protein
MVLGLVLTPAMAVMASRERGKLVEKISKEVRRRMQPAIDIGHAAVKFIDVSPPGSTDPTLMMQLIPFDTMRAIRRAFYQFPESMADGVEPAMSTSFLSGNQYPIDQLKAERAFRKFFDTPIERGYSPIEAWRAIRKYTDEVAGSRAKPFLFEPHLDSKIGFAMGKNKEFKQKVDMLHQLAPRAIRVANRLLKVSRALHEVPKTLDERWGAWVSWLYLKYVFKDTPLYWVATITPPEIPIEEAIEPGAFMGKMAFSLLSFGFGL